MFILFLQTPCNQLFSCSFIPTSFIHNQPYRFTHLQPAFPFIIPTTDCDCNQLIHSYTRTGTKYFKTNLNVLFSWVCVEQWSEVVYINIVSWVASPGGDGWKEVMSPALHLEKNRSRKRWPLKAALLISCYSSHLRTVFMDHFLASSVFVESSMSFVHVFFSTLRKRFDPKCINMIKYDRCSSSLPFL